MIEFRQINVILLAAGLSQRFGVGDKLAEELDGKPLALHIGGTLASKPFGTKFAVCAADTGPVADGLRSLGFGIIVNGEAERGQGHSLALGAKAASASGGQAALVCLADMPFVPRAHLEALAAAFMPEEPRVIASTEGTHGGPPALFPARYLADLAGLDGDKGARHLLADAVLVHADEHSLVDIDRPSDLAAARS